jgi:hypothetical protein
VQNTAVACPQLPSPPLSRNLLVSKKARTSVSRAPRNRSSSAGVLPTNVGLLAGLLADEAVSPMHGADPTQVVHWLRRWVPMCPPELHLLLTPAERSTDRESP